VRAAPDATRVLTAALPRSATQIAEATVPGVVSITASSGGNVSSVAGGTGFVLDRTGRIVTNQHVVSGASFVHVSFADGTKVKARILAQDKLLDLAVIKVDVPAAVLKPLTLGDSDALRLGDPVMAIGNPFGLDRSVSVGVVSGLRRQIEAPNGFTLSNAIQTDAAINHGNSGGPLVDGQGRVVGVNAQIADSGVNANVGVGFSIAVDPAVRRAIARMAQGQTVPHAWLGVSVDEVDAVLGTSDRVKTDAGVLITGVVPGGPAAKAGLKGGSSVASVEGSQYCLGGDIVTKVGDTRVMTSGEMQTAIARSTPGATIPVTVVRADGSTKTLKVTLGSQPSSPPSTTTGCR
jgi:S1-C subfamily serine protease